MEIKIEKTEDYEMLAKLNETVQALHQKLYPKEFKEFDLTSVKNAFAKILSAPNAYAFIAKNDEKSIGYILCLVKTRKENEFQFEKTALYIDQISVQQNYRNNGIAKQLLAQTMKLAKELNIDEIQLDYWDQNIEADTFFTSNDFKCFNYRMRIINANKV